jgi:hypothetical protein
VDQLDCQPNFQRAVEAAAAAVHVHKMYNMENKAATPSERESHRVYVFIYRCMHVYISCLMRAACLPASHRFTVGCLETTEGQDYITLQLRNHNPPQMIS